MNHSDEQEETPTKPSNDVDALTVLRTETALSRFPLHRIAKKTGDIAIEIHNRASAVEWSVSYNTRYGPPGPLAYRIDTLLVNRRIEESGRPVPRLIKLGSLPEIAEELGISGNNWNVLRRALHQNASAYITAKISYRTVNRTERFLEAGFNRYNVIFTGEKLPNGEIASAVYLVLSDIFLEVLNNALWRPLDYDYMKSLPPGSQRFYEIVSFQIYAALHYKNPRAKFAYSEYCLLSTATRYRDFEHVKKQMYKILRPHIQSGYIAKIEYEATINEHNEPDWIMYLTPGANANREYQAFTSEGLTQTPKAKKAKTTPKVKAAPKTKRAQVAGEQAIAKENLSLPFDAPETPVQNDFETVGSGIAEDPPTGGTSAPEGIDADLVANLVAADLNRGDAKRFARERPDVCRRQLEYLPFIEKFKTSRGAYLRRAIEEDFGPPSGFARHLEEREAQKAAKSQKARELFEANQEKARQSHQERFYGAYLEFMRERVVEVKTTHPGAFLAFLEWEGEQRSVYFKPPFAGRPMNERALEIFDREEGHLERFCTFFRERGAPIPTFWEWDERANPEPLLP